ncbi:MAG: FkbM family methyltransferase [Bacteroidia bacterium]
MSYRINPFQQINEKAILLLAYLPGRFYKFIPSYLREQNRALNASLSNSYEINSDNNAYIISKNGISYRIRKKSTDFLVFEQVILNQEYKPFLDLIKKYSQNKGLNLVDAGSNVGFASLYLNEHLNINRIVSIEPSKENIKNLKENFHSNSITNIHIYETGLWEKKTRLKLDTNFRDGREWSLRLIETNENDPDGFDCISIENIFDDEKIEIIDILKIDIEGGEKEVFKAFEKDNSILSKIKFIAIEIHDEIADREKINTQLLDAGFEIETVGETTIGVNKNLVL